MALNDRFLLGGCAAALLLTLAAAWLLVSASSASPQPSPDPVAASGPTSAESTTAAQATGGDLVVDVEGAVAEAGIVHLPAGSRVADALFAAGGYAPDADLAAAARQLNLAASVSDGEQVYVPRVGEASSAGTGGTGSGGTGLVNLNSATPEQLDGLPGIGPVTVQKIVAARQERRFQTLDELVERKVLSNSQLAKIRSLATV
jgi:competence protein ComEA